MRGIVHDHVVKAAVVGRDRFNDFDEGLDLDFDAGLFANLAHRCVTQSLAPFEGSARHHPAAVVRSLAPLDEKHVVGVVEDHGAHADQGAGTRPRRIFAQSGATVGSTAGVSLPGAPLPSPLRRSRPIRYATGPDDA